MKILKLDLRAFGPFTGASLDLSEGNEGLHLIYGPNEAGKTSALRALEHLFFGIPGNSSDNFVHPYPKLRVGATIGKRDGSQLEFLRRKGTKNTLLEADDKTFLDEAPLRSFLGGVDQRTFSTMFGIGHQGLQEGGKEMAEGGGQLGPSLFGAAAGISNLRAVRDGLAAEAQNLFAPRGSRPTLNQKLAALKAARKAIRNAQLPSSQWTEHRRALDEANTRLAEVEAELHEALRRKSRAERIGEALPAVAQRKELLARQAALGPVPILPDDFAQRRQDAEATLKASRKAEQTVEEAVEQIDRKMQSLVVPEVLITQAEAIKRMHKQLGSHDKGQADRPGLQAQRSQLRDEAAAILRKVRPDLGLEAVDQLELTTKQQVEIRELGSGRQALVLQRDGARAEIEKCGRQLAKARADLSALPAVRNADSLKDAVRRTQNQGDLEGERIKARADVDGLRQQAAVALEQLPLWSGTLDELEKLALPAAETVDGYETQLADLDRTLSILQRDLHKSESDRAECEQGIEQLQLEREVPTEQDLDEARRRRDAGWQLVLQAWKEGEPDAAALGEFLEAADPGVDLADAYRQAVEAADEIADRLRRESTRVATLAKLQAEQRSIARRIDDLSGKVEQARTQREQIETQWSGCWKPLGIEPLLPKEMRAWLGRQRALVTQAQAIRAGQTAIAGLDDRCALHRQELERCLTDLAEPPSPEGDTLAALLARGQAAAERLDGENGQRRQLEQEIARLSEESNEAQAGVQKAEAELTAWQGQWALAIEPLGLPPETAPAVANEVVARIDEIFDRLKDARNRTERIDGIDRDADRFREEVQQLARQVDPELASLPVEQQAEQVYARTQKALRDDGKLRTLADERKQRDRELEEGQRTIDEMTARLDAMCQDAGCTDHEALPEAIKASAEAVGLRDELKGVEAPLLRLGGGATIDEFVAEAESVDPDELPGQLEQLGEQIEQLEAERDALRETKGREENELETMDTGPTAADAAQQEQQLLAQIETDALHYARLRLASAVLREGIERYRKQNEGPVLRRASERFAELTHRSFEGLRADVDLRGDNVLVGVRPGGTDTVPLAGFSDGTCDQLYLALRLASLENYLDGKEPIPFIVDDVLISFDDTRAAAALEVLAEFSRRTQILFFTHHLHLVRLAKEHLDPGSLFVHHLARNGGEGGL